MKDLKNFLIAIPISHDKALKKLAEDDEKSRTKYIAKVLRKHLETEAKSNKSIKKLLEDPEVPLSI